jgi:hypothetical protein
MIISRIIASAILTLSLAGASWAATPEQVGTYSGSIKVTATSASGKTTVKSEMQMDVAADNTTTITIGGATQVVSTVYYNATDGFCAYVDPLSTEINIISFNFKGTTIKGTGTGLKINPTPSPVIQAATSSKFKLKKQ